MCGSRNSLIHKDGTAAPHSKLIDVGATYDNAAAGEADIRCITDNGVVGGSAEAKAAFPDVEEATRNKTTNEQCKIS